MKVSFLTTLWKNSPKEIFFDRISQIIAWGLLFCSKIFIYPSNFILTIRMKLWHSCRKKSPIFRRSSTRSTNKYLIKYVSSVQSDCRFDKSVANFPQNVQNFFQNFPTLNTKMNIAEKTPFQKMFFRFCRKQFC